MNYNRRLYYEMPRDGRPPLKIGIYLTLDGVTIYTDLCSAQIAPNENGFEVYVVDCKKGITPFHAEFTEEDEDD